MSSNKAAPNACDACPFSDSCHSTFGTSKAGHGLYPYNEAAVLRAVRACVDPENPQLFSPRRVLAGAVREVLMDAAGQLTRGDFPPGRLLGERTRAAGLPSLPLALRQRLEEDYPKDLASRLESMLAFWGKAGARPIPDLVFTTFGLDPITLDDGSGVAAEPESTAGDTDERQATTDSLPKSVQRQLEAIEDWSAKDKTLPQDIARIIRSLVREAVLARVEWFDPVIKSPDAESIKRALPDNARSISIVGAQEGIGQGVEPIVRIKRTARSAVLLQGLVLVQSGLADLSGDALARLDALAVGAVQRAKSRILAALEYDEVAMIAAARSLIIGALVCGHIASTARDVDLIRAAVWRGDTSREDTASRHPQWVDSHRAYAAERSAVVERFLGGIGAAQGAGGVHALDSVRLTKIVKAARSQLDELPTSVPSWCVDANRKLGILVQVAPVQVSYWSDLIRRVRRLLPESESYVDTFGAVVLAALEGQAQGLVKVKDLRALEQENDAARTLDSRGVPEVERVLTSAASQSGVALARHLGQPVGRDLKYIAEYLEETERWVESGISDAEIDPGAKIDIDEAIDSQVTRWLHILSNGADDD